MKEVDKLALVGGARSLSGSVVWPFIGFALYDVYHFPFSAVSAFYLLQGAVSLVAYLLGGYFTDLLGRVKTMLLSTASSSLSLLLAYLLNYPLAVVSLILVQTFFNSAYNVANTSIIGDLTTGFGRLVRAFSRVRVGINAGWAVGPVIGGLVFSTLGFRAVLLVSSLASLVFIPLILSLPEYKGRIEVSLHVNKDFAFFLVPTFMTFMVMGQLGFPLLTFYNLVDKLSTFQVGLLFMTNGVLIVALQELVGRRLTQRVISVGMLLYSASYFAVAFVTSFLLALVDVVFITLAEMVVSPLSQAIASSLTDKETRGRSIGIYGMVTALGRVAGSAFTGYMMGPFLFAPVVLWGSVASLGVASALLYAVSGAIRERKG
ncbi:MAG: MFS transporter [Candidatus Aramenus sp.]|nr:MFS transporter [Candidatus Aramenus sp.]